MCLAVNFLLKFILLDIQFKDTYLSSALGYFKMYFQLLIYIFAPLDHLVGYVRN